MKPILEPPADFKARVIRGILEQLERDLQLLTTAALVAREVATHAESKAEDRYDTRGLEASYLAGAQAKRAAEIRELVVLYKNLKTAYFRRPRQWAPPRQSWGLSPKSGNNERRAAVAWNPSLAGAKIEDTFLVARTGLTNLTHDPEWPAADIEGRARPLPLERP